ASPIPSRGSSCLSSLSSAWAWACGSWSRDWGRGPGSDRDVRSRAAMSTSVAAAQRAQTPSGSTVVGVLAAISVSHLLNDTLQSLIPSIYPLLKSSLRLNFSQIGLITLTLQLTASMLQPVVGMYTDRRPMPYSLVGGMTFTLVGLLLLSVASTLGVILFAAGLMGVGSSIFHPES